MKELRIYDSKKINKSNYIIGLGHLINAVNCVDSSILQGEWGVLQGAWGYGEIICEIEDMVNKGKICVVKYEELFPLLIEDRQYFFHVELAKVGSNVSIGIIDSTYLFFQCEDEEILKKVKEKFNNTKLVSLVPES